MSAVAFADNGDYDNGYDYENDYNGYEYENGYNGYEDENGYQDIEPISEEIETTAFVIPVPERVVVSAWQIELDGELVEGAQPYNIDGHNYFMLRDVAMMMNGTGSQFSVEFDAAANRVLVVTGEAYEPIGGELEAHEDRSATTVPSAQALYVDGERVDVLVYNIGGNNFFQIRGLADLLGFEVVSYDAEERIFVVETAPIVDENGDEEDEDEDADDEDDEDEDADDEDDEEDDEDEEDEA